MSELLPSLIRQANETATEKAVSWLDPLVIATLVLAAGTIFLAILTYFVIRESKKMREETHKILKAGQQPSFASEPGEYLGRSNKEHSDNFTKLNLVNHGATATDITARCMWLDSEKGGGSSKTFYILSLAKHGYAGLDIPVTKIVNERKYIKVEIDCKDAVGEPYHATITNGLDKVKEPEITMAYQNNVWFTIYDALDRIGKALEKR